MTDFTVKNFIEWLEKQPAEKRYDWTSPLDCALGQWCRSKGMKPASVKKKSIELGCDDIFYDIALRGYPYTFGVALENAKAISPAERPDIEKSGEGQS